MFPKLVNKTQLDLVLDEAWNRTLSLENKYELKDFERNELGFTR